MFRSTDFSFSSSISIAGPFTPDIVIDDDDEEDEEEDDDGIAELVVVVFIVVVVVVGVVDDEAITSDGIVESEELFLSADTSLIGTLSSDVIFGFTADDCSDGSGVVLLLLLLLLLLTPSCFDVLGDEFDDNGCSWAVFSFLFFGGDSSEMKGRGF